VEDDGTEEIILQWISTGFFQYTCRRHDHILQRITSSSFKKTYACKITNSLKHDYKEKLPLL
jgi:hypothetical protein